MRAMWLWPHSTMRRLLAVEAPLDLGRRRKPHPAVRLDGLQQIGGVAVRRAVTEQQIFSTSAVASRVESQAV